MSHKTSLSLFLLTLLVSAPTAFGQSPEGFHQDHSGNGIHVLRRSGLHSTCAEATPQEIEGFSKPVTARLHLLTGFTPNQSGGLKIILRGTDQLERFPDAKAAFVKAAQTWESLIKTPITVIIDVDYGPNRFGTPYPSGVLGSTNSQILVNGNGYSLFRDALIQRASSPEEKSLYQSLPPLILIDGNLSTNIIFGPSALFRANGLVKAVADPPSETNFGPVPSIGFNSNFKFDFDPSNGIDPDKTDFDAVAIHEIGHALGFNSFVGNRESGGTFGPAVWDLFRFRPGVTADTFGGTPRQLYSGGDHVFFGGTSQIPLSTGRANGAGGDGNQASHWKADEYTGQYVGIMDPTLADGVRETITQADLFALDLMGYELTAQPEYDRAAPRVSGLSPNGGESFTVGDAINVKWTSSDNKKIVGQRIDLSLDGGATFPVTIAAGIPGTAGEFSWTIRPGSDSREARVRVTAFDELLNQGTAVSTQNLTIRPQRVAAGTPAPREAESSVSGGQIRISWKAPEGAARPEFSPNQSPTLVKPEGVRSIARFLDSAADSAFIPAGPIVFGEQIVPPAYPADLKSVLYLSMNSFFRGATKPFPSAAGANLKLYVFQSPTFGSVAEPKNLRTYNVTLQREPKDFGNIQEPTDSDPGDLNEFVLPEEYTITEGSFFVALQFVDAGSSLLNSDGGDFLIVYDGNEPSTAVLSTAQNKFQGVGVDYTFPNNALIRPDFAFMGRVEQRGSAQVTGYSVYRSTASPVAVSQANKIGSVGPTTTTFTDETAVPNTRYNYVVTAQYASGESLASNEITATATGNDIQPPTVKVTAPNGGETFMSGGRIDIKWSATDNVGVVTQTVELSTDGGLSFPVPVATGLNGSFSAFIHEIPTTLKSDRARVRVTSTDAAGNKASDVSDADFRIVGVDVAPPTVKVLAPNGGEKFKAGATAKITWQSSDDTGVVAHDVLLSTDGGKTFAVKLASGLPGTTQSFDFVVPSTKTKAARIRVVARDAAGNTAEDDGDGDFTIKVKK